MAPPIALVLVGVLLVEPPAITPPDRLPTLRVLAQEFFEVEVPGTTLRLPAGRWRRSAPRESFAESFEATTRRPGEVYPQLLTIYKLAMQANERIGILVAPDEYVEFLYAYPPKITYRGLLDRGDFWVESVQTFEVPMGRPLPVAWKLGQATSEAENWRLLALYDSEVKATRFQFQQLF